jgi:hypothetical protein
MLKFFYPYFILLLIGFGLMSCADDKVFTVGQNLVELKGDIVVIDSSTVHSYTIKLDSIQTASKSVALVGKYTDGNFGTTLASSFFEVGLPSTHSTFNKDRAIFDSICVVFKPSGAFYGDSTKPVTVQVHKMNEKLEDIGSSYRYNVSKVLYSDDILGSATRVVKPAKNKNFRIRLDDVFGQGLFEIIKNKGSEIDNNTNFLKYLKGLAITPDPASESSAIIGFKVVTDSLPVMRLYYHQSHDQDSITFGFYNTTYQYNEITTDYAGSPLVALTDQKEKVSSLVTNNESYCQAGTALMTRIEFPYLKNLFRTYSAYTIAKAELIMPVVRQTYKMITLPEILTLYSVSSNNALGSQLSTGTQGSYVTSRPYTNGMTNQTFYSFDITYYFTNIVNNLTDTPPALVVSIPYDQIATSVQRVVFGDYYHPKDNIQLKITYWKY